MTEETVVGAKTSEGGRRPPYIVEHEDGHDRDGYKILNDPDGKTRRGVSGDKLRRKAFEKKL